MLLTRLVETSAAVAATRSRREKAELLAAVLREVEPEEVVPAVAYLSGELRQRQIGVGWRSIQDVPAPAAEPSLTVAAVDTACARIGATTGAGSQAQRRTLLGDLFGRATAVEQEFLRRLLTGELRQGALAGLMVDAISRATGIEVPHVRRALLLSGDLRGVAAAALGGGAAALAEFRLEVGRALEPMLAGTAPDIDSAIEKVCPAAVEYKLDGIRIQAHRDGDQVRLFTRSLDDVTARLPEVVEVVRALPVRQIVLDGEVIALDDDGRPHRFQVTASRTGQRGDPRRLRERMPLTAAFFDILHLDGDDLLDEPGDRRWSALEKVVPAAARITREVVESAEAAGRVYAAALAAGHEGVVVKALDVPYQNGRRGGGWLKVKPRHTLDLVVLAVEQGHGRRRGWLSNLHLGARDEATGDFVMLGKTFKGMTDEMLAWQTEKLRALAVEEGDWVVRVRPELVVEIAFDGVQNSTRYPGGMALRFARVLRYREDKKASEADTVETVRAIYEGRPTA
ncbi:ATP-dependent DNA ligase [Fodinicola acaciae]|uniref:ATP-dependent DNA ligase n=1 Tax=Fodinicola acaciae TaxID=2681555 RepID=UPI0013D1B749|nr:ATP-dependent DNA ligase [Fodinicola acaciae]